MIIAAFSDLHLGDGTNADDFGRIWYRKCSNDIKFLGKMAKVWKDVDEIIMVGDVYNTDKFKMRDIREAHPAVVSWIEKNTVVLRGNHDYGLTGRLTHRVDDVLFSHGFQNDPLMTSAFARVGVYLLSWVERLFPDANNPRRWRGVWRKKRFKNSRIERNTREYARGHAGGYDAVVCGHTHRQAEELLTKHAGALTLAIAYMNCGACTHGRFEGVMIDTEKLEAAKIRL